MTQVFFDADLTAEFIGATTILMLLGVMFIGVMMIFSVVIRSQAGAAGAGLGVYLLMAILSAWGPAAEYSPAGLMGAANHILVGEETGIIWPVLTGLMVVFGSIAFAAAIFRRQEL